MSSCTRGRVPARRPEPRRARTEGCVAPSGLFLTAAKGEAPLFGETTGGCSTEFPLSGLDVPKEGT